MNVEEKKAQARAAVNAVLALSEAIRELGEVPNGVLYAQVLGHIPDLATYERILGILKGAGVVEERAHVLRWIGPTLDEPKTSGANPVPCPCGSGQCNECDDNGMIASEGSEV